MGTDEKKLPEALDLGYGLDGGGKHINEFWGILEPAGFYVYQADKLEAGERDTFILKVARKIPKKPKNRRRSRSRVWL